MPTFPTCAPLREFKVKRAEYARVRDIDKNTYREIVSADFNWQFNILFINGDWNRLPIAPDATYRLNQSDTNQGALYDHDLGIGVPGTAKATTPALVNLAEEDLLIRVYDTEGNPYIFGTIEAPARLSFTKTIGNGASAAVTISCRGRHPLYNYAPVVNV